MEAIKGLTQESSKIHFKPVSSASPSSTDKNKTSDYFQASPDTHKEKEVMNAKINRIAEAMDNYVQSIQRDLKIQVHEGTGDIIVRVTSHDSGKVIREIPPKELLDLAARMEEMAGTIFDENV